MLSFNAVYAYDPTMSWLSRVPLDDCAAGRASRRRKQASINQVAAYVPSHTCDHPTTDQARHGRCRQALHYP